MNESESTIALAQYRTGILERIKDVKGKTVCAFHEAITEIDLLREERDDARRELCIGLADHTHCEFNLPPGCWNHLRVEKARGWDCFKETP